MISDQIEVYVRSSPLGPEGIHWRNVSLSKPEQPKGTPDILMKQVVPDNDGSKISINSAIDTVKPCLVLAKYNGQLLLEVTGIDATPDRSEKLGRRISEVVLWVGDDTEETETQLRQLAYCALLGLWKSESKFRAAISSSIKFDGLNDYKVESHVLNDMYECPEKYFELEGDSLSSHNYLESNEFKTSQDVIQLATQLRDKSFDDMETAVVISEIKQTESERWLNHRGNVAKQLEVAPVTSPIVSSTEPVMASSGDATVKKPQGKAYVLKFRSRLIVLVIALVLLLLTFLVLSNQYLFKTGDIDQPIPVLEALPMQ